MGKEEENLFTPIEMCHNKGSILWLNKKERVDETQWEKKALPWGKRPRNDQGWG